MQKPETPKVGVGVVIINDENKVLLGKRKGSHGPGEYSLPGGHLEMFERLDDCCSREVLEETGIKVYAFKKLDFFSNTFPDDGLHYVTLFFHAIDFNGGDACPENKEPNKCEGWGWYSLNDLPQPIFGSTEEVCQELSNRTRFRMMRGNDNAKS